MHKKSYFPPAVVVVPIRMETEILTGSNIDSGATVDPLIEDEVFVFDIL